MRRWPDGTNRISRVWRVGGLNCISRVSCISRVGGVSGVSRVSCINRVSRVSRVSCTNLVGMVNPVIADPVRNGAPAGSSPISAARACALSAFLIAAAAASWLRVFDWDASLTLIAAIAAGVTSAAFGFVIAKRLRRSKPLRNAPVAATAAGIGVGWAGLALIAADPVTSLPPWLAVPWTALSEGWMNLLTMQLPVPAAREFIALPVALVIVAAASAAIALRARRPVPAIAVATAVWGIGVVLGVGGTGSLVIVTLPIGLAILAVLAYISASDTAGSARSQPSLTVTSSDGRSVAASASGAASTATDMAGTARRKVARSLAAAGALVIVAIPVAFAAGAPISVTMQPKPLDPRSVVTPPQSRQPISDPLDLLGNPETAATGQPVFTVRVEGAPGQTQPYWRIATFDRYDGNAWSTSGTTTTAASLNPEPLQVQTASQRLTVRASPQLGPWVPAWGQLVRLRSTGLEVNRDADIVLAAGGGEHESVIDTALPVTEEQPRIMAWSNGSAPPIDGLTDFPANCLPQQWVNAIAGKRGTYAAKTLAVIDTIKGLIDPSSNQLSWPDNQTLTRPGQSCARLKLAADGTDKDVGSAQLATAAVLALRLKGISARLAFGYRVTGVGADGLYSAYPADAQAYPEVWFDGLGWMPFSVAPDSATDQSPAAKLAHEILKKAGAPGKPVDKNAAREPTASIEPPSKPGNPAAIAGASLVMIFGLYLLVVFAIRRIRRRRRRSGDPRNQVLGALAELLDDVADLSVDQDSWPDRANGGMPAGAATGSGAPVATAVMERTVRTRTAKDRAAILAIQLPEAATSAATLAQLVELAVYSPEPVGADSGSVAWRCRDIVGRAARRRRSFGRRLKHALTV